MYLLNNHIYYVVHFAFMVSLQNISLYVDIDLIGSSYRTTWGSSYQKPYLTATYNVTVMQNESAVDLAET